MGLVEKESLIANRNPMEGMPTLLCGVLEIIEASEGVVGEIRGCSV